VTRSSDVSRQQWPGGRNACCVSAAPSSAATQASTLAHGSPSPSKAACDRFAEPASTHGDVKTERSRRTLALPLIAVTALKAHREREPDTSDLVLATRTGEALDPANVRREFRAVCTRANIGENWTPRELRHSFVSLMSNSGVPVEEIARLAGHSSSRTTEVVCRRELRPVLTTGAEAMDRLFALPSPSENNLTDLPRSLQTFRRGRPR